MACFLDFPFARQVLKLDVLVLVVHSVFTKYGKSFCRPVPSFVDVHLLGGAGGGLAREGCENKCTMKCSVAFLGPEQVKELSHGDAKPFPGIVDRRTVDHPQCEPDFAKALNLRYRYAYSGPAITALISPSSEPWMFTTLVSWFFVPPWHDWNSGSVPLRFLVEED